MGLYIFAYRSSAFGPGYTDPFSFGNTMIYGLPSVYTETMKTIMKTQTFEYAIQSGLIRKRNDLKTYRCNWGLSLRMGQFSDSVETHPRTNEVKVTPVRKVGFGSLKVGFIMITRTLYLYFTSHFPLLKMRLSEQLSFEVWYA